MSTALLIHVNFMQLLPLLRIVATWGALCAVLLAFRPLLTGIARAAWLVLFPRLSREQLAGLAHMRDRGVLQGLIDSSSSPSETSELRAMAARD